MIIMKKYGEPITIAFMNQKILYEINSDDFRFIGGHHNNWRCSNPSFE